MLRGPGRQQRRGRQVVNEHRCDRRQRGRGPASEMAEQLGWPRPGPSQRAQRHRDAEQADQHRHAEDVRDVTGAVPPLAKPDRGDRGADRGDRDGRRAQHDDQDGGDRDRRQAESQPGTLRRRKLARPRAQRPALGHRDDAGGHPQRGQPR
jgi:hypothetical protein